MFSGFDCCPRVDSIEKYISVVNQFPRLSREIEISLLKMAFVDKDMSALKMLILSNLRYVVRIAGTYLGYGFAYCDLIQAGNFGLMKSLRKFKVEYGVRFMTFAIHWVKAEIHEFIIQNWRIVKVATTKAHRKLFFRLRGMKSGIGKASKNEVANISRALNVTREDVKRIDGGFIKDLSLDEPIYEEGRESMMDRISDESTNPIVVMEEEHKKRIIEKMKTFIDGLDRRSKEILESRWLSDTKETLESLSNRFGVSIERIRQVEKQAIEKIRTYMGNTQYVF